MQLFGVAACAAAVLLLAACQTSQVVTNAPLPHAENHAPNYGGGYRLSALIRDPKGEVLAVMAFSGGGKRSAAFAHGALRGAAKFMLREDRGPRTLLDEVDMIAGVSGGSFPAMHYGLYRNKSFDTFPEDFLYRDINSYIWGMYLLPWNWEWLVNPLFGTNDRMADIYDHLMFHGATYGDLVRQGLPFISVNATDIAGGVPFPFSQGSFDQLCSDLTSFPVTRAVAASNGFPVLFTPITLNSYRAGCGTARPPDAPDPAWQFSGDLSRRAELAAQAARYMDPERTSYVHLMDGGISDNLALRTLVNALFSLDKSTPLFRQIALQTRRVVVISVDGQAATDPTLGQTRIVTGLGQILGAVSGTQIDAYNFETLLLAQERTKSVVADLRTIRCGVAPVIAGHPCADVEGDLIHLSLQEITDPMERARLQAIPTGLTIPKPDVDALVNYGEKLILQNAALHKLLDGMAAPGM